MAAILAAFFYNHIQTIKQKIMKITFLRNAFVVAALVGGLCLTSCKKETTTTETETVVTEGDTTTVTDTEMVDETGTKDTMSVSTDTITVKTP